MSDDKGRVEHTTEDGAAAREAMNRAIKRLNVLEALILAAAAGAAMVGGWLAAFLASGSLGWPFRPTWIVSAFLLFVVPGVLVFGRERRNRRTTIRRPTPNPTETESKSENDDVE